MTIDAVRAKDITKGLHCVRLMDSRAIIIPQAVRNITDSKVT